MSKTYYAIADCKHGIKPQFCLACAKERIAYLERLLRQCYETMRDDGHSSESLIPVKEALK